MDTSGIKHRTRHDLRVLRRGTHTEALGLNPDIAAGTYRGNVVRFADGTLLTVDQGMRGLVLVVSSVDDVRAGTLTLWTVDP